jgi:hypothetical protein
MLSFRCLSNRLLTHRVILPSSRYLLHGATNPQTNNEHIQPTINVIKQDLQLIHRDILQVSKTQLIISFLFFQIFTLFSQNNVWLHHRKLMNQ